MSIIIQSMQISTLSFWLGLLSGILLLWLLYRLRRNIFRFIRETFQRLTDFRKNWSPDTSSNLHNDIYRFSQKQHVAASLFSLNEIAIEPRVLLPLSQIPGSSDLFPTDIVSLSVPYIPDWPELAAIYNAPTYTIIDALQGGGNIILAGHPGSGKTFTLAWLAASISHNFKGLGNLSGLLPIYLHATDIPGIIDTENVEIDTSNELNPEFSGDSNPQRHSKVKKPGEVIDLFIQAISTYASPITLRQLNRDVINAIDNRRAILLIDRVDELPPSQARVITDYLRIFIEKYPGLRIVVAVSYDDFVGLPNLGFNLLGLAALDNKRRENLLQKWIDQWSNNITQIDKVHLSKINPYFVKSWLDSQNKLLNPLELTLKIWAGLSGDILGPDGPHAIEAYFRRTGGKATETFSGLEQLALQQLIDMRVAVNPHDIKRIVNEYKSEIKAFEEDNSNSKKEHESIPIKVPLTEKIPDLDILVENGLLIKYNGTRYGFSHPVFCGYLAGKALSKSGVISRIDQQPNWILKNLSFFYLSKFGDVTSLIQHYLLDDDILHSNHLLISRWLQIAPKNQAWRTILLRTLTTILQKERESISLSAKIFSALAFSGDKGVSILFRQLLKSEHPNLKQLAILGCGILEDKNSVEELNQLLSATQPSFTRAASLALAEIGDKRSLEILATNLLNGDDNLRKFAAEALANEPIEGHTALQEGSSMEDLHIRRAAVFGLIRIDQPWATKIVENLQLEDKEWVVRNAAIEAFHELQKRKQFSPMPTQELIEAQWLTEFANKNGTTIAPGKPVDDLVQKALLQGTKEEIIAAINYYQNSFNPKIMKLIATIYSKNSGDIHDTAYYLLWLMNTAGIKLPFAHEL